MECRICHQSIGFLRGRFPERKKTTTLAVHEAEMPRLLQQVNCVIVNPHPGAQRKLRQELEAHHSNHTAQPATNGTPVSASMNGDQHHAAETPEASAAPPETDSVTETYPQQQEPERAEARAHASR